MPVIEGSKKAGWAASNPSRSQEDMTLFNESASLNHSTSSNQSAQSITNHRSILTPLRPNISSLGRPLIAHSSYLACDQLDLPHPSYKFHVATLGSRLWQCDLKPLSDMPLQFPHSMCCRRAVYCRSISRQHSLSLDASLEGCPISHE